MTDSTPEARPQTALAAPTKRPVKHLVTKAGGRLIHPTILRQFIFLNEQGKSTLEIAALLHVARSTVIRWKSFQKKGTFDTYVEKMKRIAGKGATSKKMSQDPSSAQKLAKFSPIAKKIIRSLEKGLTIKQISQKHGVSSGHVYYYKARYERSQGLKPPKGEITNGPSRSFNKNILLGIAYAETERFIANLAERIKVSPQVLRRRLPELLGHSPLWE